MGVILKSTMFLNSNGLKKYALILLRNVGGYHSFQSMSV